MKKRTYDIINAGPRNRFMANGRIVSNSSHGWQAHNLTRDAFGKDYENIAEQNGLDPKKDKARVRQLAAKALNVAIEAGRTGDPDLLRSLYETTRRDLQGRATVHGVLPWVSRMMRRVICAPAGKLLLNGDFANIEARIPVWLAGQQETVDAFARGEDLYRLQASPIYGVPPDQLTSEQRQIGKVCIAQDSLVLTDKGLIPIQKVTIDEKVWDGVSWVSHDGPIFRGWKKTIEYQGLCATPDHEVWIDGQSRPVELREAATAKKNLAITGVGRRNVRLGVHRLRRSKTYIKKQSQICFYAMLGLRTNAVVLLRSFEKRKIIRLPEMFATCSDTCLSQKNTELSKNALYQSKRQKLQKLRCAWNSVSVFFCSRSWAMGFKEYRRAAEGKLYFRFRQNRQQWTLCTGQFALVDASCEFYEPPNNAPSAIQKQKDSTRPFDSCDTSSSSTMRLCGQHIAAVIRRLRFARRNVESNRQPSEHMQTTRPVWDILNAGPNYRFTVSGHLVSNCRLFLGFAAGVNAFIPAAMNYGLTISREQGVNFVDIFRSTNKKLMDFIDANLQAAIWAVQYPGREFFVPPTGLISWMLVENCLHLRLPSGRILRYWAPRLEQGYWPDGRPKPSLDLTVMVIKGRAVFRRSLWRGLAIENPVQAIAADMLAQSLKNMEEAGIPVVLHVHDSVAAEVDEDRAEEVLPVFKQCMLSQPDWTKGLPTAVDADVSARFG